MTALREPPGRAARQFRCRHAGGRPDGPTVNGVRFDLAGSDDLLAALDAYLACGRSHVVHFFAGHPTVLARGDAAYRELVNRGDLNICDGVSVELALRLSGARTERIPGSVGLDLICGWGVHRGLRHYFYGGSPEVVAQLTHALELAHPGIEIVGAESPPFGAVAELDLGAAAKRIQEACADVVWVGLGVPKQDLAADRLRELDAAPAIVCVGAAFDFVSGEKARAPRWMQRAGVEWLFRLLSEPRRLWRRYLIGGPAFVAGVALDRLRSGAAR